MLFSFKTLLAVLRSKTNEKDFLFEYNSSSAHEYYSLKKMQKKNFVKKINKDVF